MPPRWLLVPQHPLTVHPCGGRSPLPLHLGSYLHPRGTRVPARHRLLPHALHGRHPDAAPGAGPGPADGGGISSGQENTSGWSHWVLSDPGAGMAPGLEALVMPFSHPWRLEIGVSCMSPPVGNVSTSPLALPDTSGPTTLTLGIRELLLASSQPCRSGDEPPSLQHTQSLGGTLLPPAQRDPSHAHGLWTHCSEPKTGGRKPRCLGRAKPGPLCSLLGSDH